MKYSNSPFESVIKMTDTFGMREILPNQVILDYRMDLLREEMKETEDALDSEDAERLVDGHMDLIVVSLGNLAIMRVNIDKAFDEVMEANMRKISGKRIGSDPEGMSITKPSSWNNPSHINNHGELDVIFSKK